LDGKETIECKYRPFATVPVQSMLSEISLPDTRAVGRDDTNYHVGGDLIHVDEIRDASGVTIGREAEVAAKDNI